MKGLIMGDENLEKLISLANRIAKPYKFCVYVLSILLLLSMGINLYLFTNNSVDLDLYAESNSDSTINQSNG
jgi:hypothetical protein